MGTCRALSSENRLSATISSVCSPSAAPWRADDAARRLGVSCGYFHALYKKYFDTTFLADVVRARVQAAEELLVSSVDSVERIAERCGYNNTEHFIRQFRARTGTTPTGYRKSR